MDNLARLVEEIRACRLCEQHLPLGANPVVRGTKKARILIVGQAPGVRVHNSGLPFDDPSGDRLRQWLGVDRETFYNEDNFAIFPMGFCYPGTRQGGDLPPRPECAQTWRQRLHKNLENIELTLLFGKYALNYYLPETRHQPLTQTVQDWQKYQPHYLPMPHPSPRNIRWFKANPWFEEQVIPHLKQQVKPLLD
tara:strand:- start:493 stop:1074 length:582 start_codon:yes stop_codon:yes gene_type:complete